MRGREGKARAAHNICEVDICSILDELVGDGIVWRLSAHEMKSGVAIHILKIDINSLLKKIESERDAIDGTRTVKGCVA
jgi:hypothetical protein